MGRQHAALVAILSKSGLRELYTARPGAVSCSPITAKKSRRPRTPAPDREAPDIRHIFALHIQASQRRDELLKEARALQAAGRISAARKLLNQAQEIQQRLTALELECLAPNPHQ
jgi:hypothetical protein